MHLSLHRRTPLSSKTARIAHVATALFLSVMLAALGCSDTPGGNGTGASSGGGTSGGGTSGGFSSSSGASSGGTSGGFSLEKQIEIAVDPKKLVFPDIDPTADPYIIKLRVSHAGQNGQLSLDAIKFVPDNGEFTVKNFAPAKLDVGKVVDWDIVYKPKKSGGKALNLVITNNDSDADDREFEVPVIVQKATGSIDISPNPVDFGPVATGKCADKSAKLYNVGQKPIKLVSVDLSKAGSPDFTIKSKPDFTKAIPPGKAVEVLLTFCPKPGADNDTTELVVETDDGKLAIAKVFGGEIVPKITVIPPTLDFGSLKLGSKGTRAFKVFSSGLADLEITKIELSPLSKVKTVTWSEKAPLKLKVNGNKVINVELKVENALPNNGNAVAGIMLHTNDPVRPIVNIPLFARTESGKLVITPPDVLDFAIAAKGVKVERTVHVANQGTSPITVSKVIMLDNSGGEFALIPDGFSPADASPNPQKLGANAYTKFKVSFKPKSSSGQAKGKIQIQSDDPTKPVWDVVLSGKRAEGATCVIQLIPQIVNFGMISFGKSKVSQIIIKNIGTGYCNFKEMKIKHCPATGFGPLQGPPTCNFLDPLTAWFSTFAPSTKLFALGPGETGKAQVLFDAPNDAGFFSDPKAIQSYYGFIAFKFADQATGSTKWYPKDPNDKAKVSGYKPNLIAKVGKSSVSVLPESIDFGLVTVGCKSKLQYVRVYNTGNIPAYVTKVELQGCGIEVDKVAWPGVPKKGLEISNAAPAKFGLQYAPQNVGKDTCQMVVTTGVEGQCISNQGIATGKDCKVTADCSAGHWCQGQVFSVPLVGTGTLLDEYTDEFEQGAGKKVDVLFVIDNSGSMGDEQKNIANNFKSFVSIATLWQNDYQIGVTSTDMKNGLRGRLKNLNGDRILTKNNGAPNKFPSMAKLGTNGSANEQGLAAAKAALSLPHTFDTCTTKCKTCKTDNDCPNKLFCVDAGGKKACGGSNRGFLRKKAGLEVVFVSDEEDSSTGSLKIYVDFLKNIKGFANKGLMHAHAIVGTGAQGCQAQQGKRYIQAAKETGGKIASICDQSFAKTLQDIGNVAFGLSHQFFLTMNAEPSTIKVWVNGKPCAGPSKNTSWFYEPQSNSVVFVAANSGGTCVPKKGDKVKIYYKTLCFPKGP